MIILLHEIVSGNQYEQENKCELPTGLLTREAGGIVSFLGSAGICRYTDSELNDYDYLMVGSLGDWFIALGEESRTVLIGDIFASVALTVGGIVSRICLNNCHDPGGLERVKYFGIDEESCLVETEMGFWRFSRSKGIVWGVVHEDLTRHVNKVHRDKIIVHNEYDTSLFSVTDGAHIIDKPFS